MQHSEYGKVFDSMKHKFCPACLETKPRNCFAKVHTKDGNAANCKRCVRSKHLVKKYGIRLDEWERLLESQGGACPICGKLQSEAKSTFHVDHNHKTGDIRAIICGYCNRYLMMYLHDNPKRAIGLGNYLLKWFKGD